MGKEQLMLKQNKTLEQAVVIEKQAKCLLAVKAES